jgi:hypothetical protein
MLLTIQMLHKLQIVLERQIAHLAIETRAFASLALPSARRHDGRLAHAVGDIEPGFARFGVAGVRRCRGAADVFLALRGGFGARFAFIFDLLVARDGFGGVFVAIPGFAEGGVAAGGGAVGAWFVVAHGCGWL